MDGTERFPYCMRSALQESPFENILDANMFTAYIPRDTNVPRFADPRKTTRGVGTFRQPGHVRSRYINQVFSCIGYIKRIQNLDYLKYLPILYEELGRFVLVMEEITYSMDIRTSSEVYKAQKRGFNDFFAAYHSPRDRDVEWINTIRKHQLLYLEKIDMLIETLKTQGNIFDCSDHPLYEEIVTACRGYAINEASVPTAVETASRFVANCCSKAALDGRPKVIWSGDIHVLGLLRHLYTIPAISRSFPQIYLRSSYDPMNFTELFPRWEAGKRRF